MSRGCGDRVRGGIYVETHLSEDGIPFNEFLLCPPLVVDANDLGVSSVGVKLIEHDGVWHIFDIVGKKHYPNVADFVEEASRMGVSRRLSKSLDFKKITSQSRIILLHDHAHIENFNQYPHDAESCPKNVIQHKCEDLKEMCAGLWWQDIVKGDKEKKEDRNVIRLMPDFSYKGKEKPKGVEPEYKLAIFASFPIHNLAIVNDEVEKSHEEAFDNASKSSVMIKMVDF